MMLRRARMRHDSCKREKLPGFGSDRNARRCSGHDIQREKAAVRGAWRPGAQKMGAAAMPPRPLNGYFPECLAQETDKRKGQFGIQRPSEPALRRCAMPGTHTWVSRLQDRPAQ